MVEFIIHPKTKEKLFVTSIKGKKLINSYKKNFLKSGGSFQPETNLTQRLMEINKPYINKPKKVEDEIKIYLKAINNDKPLLLEHYYNTILKWPNNKEYQEMVKKDAILTAKKLLENKDIDETSDSKNSIIST